MSHLNGRSRGRRWLHARVDRGATAVEYGLMVGFIALVIIAAVGTFGGSVKQLFESIAANAPFG